MSDNEHHTPGPWLHDGGYRVQGNADGHRYDICRLCPPPPHLKTTSARANARLIAAAPEFLANSKVLLELVEQGVFVRNTAGDKASDPALKHLPELRVIDRFEDLVNRVTASE